jgi:hypothetical protein
MQGDAHIGICATERQHAARGGTPLHPRCCQNCCQRRAAAALFFPVGRGAGVWAAVRSFSSTALLSLKSCSKRVSASSSPGISGHATVNVTLNVYSHVTPTMQREAATTLDRLLGGA